MDIATKSYPERIVKTKAPIRSLEFSRDGKVLAVANEGGVDLWSRPTGNRRQRSRRIHSRQLSMVGIRSERKPGVRQARLIAS